MRNFLFRTLIISVLLVSNLEAFTQLSIGGKPPGLNSIIFRQSIEQIPLIAPDYDALRREDDSVSWMGVPQRMGICLPTSITPNNSGSYTDINNNEHIWRLNIIVPEAVGLALYFSDFQLAPGDKLYVYSSDESHIIGAFTDLNNNDTRLFATEVVKGESIIIELVENKWNIKKSRFNISDILVVYTPMNFPSKKSDANNGNSDECEVNSSCEEGDNWRDQIDGVVRIMVRNGSTSFWCTGALINNTSLDFSPLILTADHCALSQGRYAKPSDLAQWVFYFKYESTTCLDDTPFGSKSITGAVKLASSTPNGNDGSDFYLVRTFETIPNSFQPYFEGWSALNDLSDHGVSIHHPAGDVKKISTYIEPLQLSSWGNIPETHFSVVWSETPNGFGVTEGGSSGSPIFNSSKLLIGQLTGGVSDCTDPTGIDYYGRFYYSWDKNGSHDSLKLQPWLDPSNTGLQVLNGSYNTKVAIAQFVADETVVPVGSYVNFSDLSINAPESWKWIFESGEPSTSTDSQPGLVYYDKLGAFDVMLVVTNDWGVDTVLLENYIKVVPVIYPNPTRNNVFILLGKDQIEHEITITNLNGKKMADLIIPANTSAYEFSLLNYPAGMYIVGIKSEMESNHYKLLFTP